MNPTIFAELPTMINQFERIDINTNVNFEDPEVLLELIEYEVLFPVLSYGHGDVIYALEFHATKWIIVKRLNYKDIKNIQEEHLQYFAPNKVKEALAFLQEEVKHHSPLQLHTHL
ncbi:MAG: hypothetical protein ACH0QD_13160 [Tepidibacillus sp.]